MYLLGLDVGTQGARAIVAHAKGNLIAQSSRPFVSKRRELPAGWFEQDPCDWWEASKICLREIIKLIKPEEISALAVTSTSGTFVPVDDKNRPLRPALMYNDNRASQEAQEVSQAGSALEEKLGYKFQPSFALPKILWLRRNEPKIFERTKRFLHAADFIVGKLTGDFSISDFSNSLKTGFDLVDMCWGDWLENNLGIPKDKLPKVVSPGEVIGTISQECASETGLSTRTKVCAGATDGTASFFSSGAAKPGEWNSTLGTTLVVRGVSQNLVKDAQGRIYSHKHPEGYWLPGGASNVGGECLNSVFAGENWAELDKKAIKMSPCNLIIYPLVRKGERLPFLNVEAQGFVVGSPRNREELYVGYLEGVALVERWIFELFESLGVPVKEEIYITGGGAKSPEWTQIRANVLNRRLIKPKIVEAAFGAAIIAASKTIFGGLSEAVGEMVKVERTTEPQSDLIDKFDEKYALFREECRRRGYE